jgi:hypothetical protein
MTKFGKEKKHFQGLLSYSQLKVCMTTTITITITRKIK